MVLVVVVVSSVGGGNGGGDGGVGKLWNNLDACLHCSPRSFLYDNYGQCSHNPPPPHPELALETMRMQNDIRLMSNTNVFYLLSYHLLLLKATSYIYRMYMHENIDLYIDNRYLLTISNVAFARG